MNFTTLRSFFEEYEKKNTGKHLTAYMRLSNRDFPGAIQYDDRSRTYIISSEAALFQQGKGPELYGMPLDGTSEGDRLDDLIKDVSADGAASVEECSIAIYELSQAKENEDERTTRYFVDYLDAKEAMLKTVAEAARVSPDELLTKYHNGQPIWKDKAYEVMEDTAKAFDKNGTATVFKIETVLVPNAEHLKDFGIPI